MKRFYLIVQIVLLTVVTSVHAQTAQQPAGDTTSFTLEQSIAYALENSSNLKNSQLDEQIADARVKETRGIGLPQIDASVGIRHNEKLARFFATKQTAFGFSGLPPEQYGSFLPGVADDDVVAAPNFFQLKSSGDAGLSVNQIIFNSSYLVGLRAASAYRELAQKTSDQSKEQVVEQVTKAYYTALINQERIELFDNNIARVDSLLRTTRAMHQSGFAESIDVDRIQVNLNNLISERDNFINLQQLSLELLKFQMNYPMDKPIKVAGDIASITIDTNPDALRQNFDYTQRVDYSLLESQRRLQELDIKNQYSASMPNLVAFADLGYSTQSPNIGGVFRTMTDLDESETIGPDKWYPYMSFGVTLNVPIFSGLQRNYKIQQAKLSLLKIENNFASLKSGIDVEIKQATTSYKNALRSLESQRANMELAENIARVTKIKYEQGVGSNLEVVEAEGDLKTAQINYYNALFDVLVAKVDLEKAYGQLSENKIQQN